MKSAGKPTNLPKVRLLFLKDYKPRQDNSSLVEELQVQLRALPEFDQAQLEPKGNSMVVACVPAANTRQLERLKTIASGRLKGWRLVEEQHYKLPTSF